MNAIKRFAKAVLPPVVQNLLRACCGPARKASSPDEQEWTYLPGGWDSSQLRTARGWNAESVLRVHRQEWPGLRAVAASAEVLAGELGGHNTLLSFGYVVARASHLKTTLSMLDYGGGIGAYYLFAEALMPEVRIEYTCKELSLLADFGRSMLPCQTFTSDDACLHSRYDLVIASSSLQYTRSWQDLLETLAASSREYLYIARLPVVQGKSFVLLQKSPRYETEYAGWCINRSELLDGALRHGMKLVREFLVDETIQLPDVPENVVYRGFLFQRIPRVNHYD